MYKKILVPVDLGREKSVIRLCGVASKMASADTEVQLLSVLPGYGMSVVGSYFPEEAQQNAMKDMKVLIEKIAKEHLTGNVSTMLKQGKRAKEILAHAVDWDADLIIISSRKKASLNNHRLLGSCSASVTDRAMCSVLVVR